MNVKITSQSSFHELSSTTRREIKERIDIFSKAFDGLIKYGLHTKDDNT